MPAERLQKIIAAAGIASRRKAEELITSGRVVVNGQPVTTLGAKADVEQDTIVVDGVPLDAGSKKVYLVVNKPKGYVTTMSDPQGRPTVAAFVKAAGARLFPVGRLDYNSEGLLVLTNDGELANKLTHAAWHVPKTYLVKVSGKPADEGIERLRRGVTLPPPRRREGGRPGKYYGKPEKSAPARIRLLRDAPNPWYEVTITQGLNRQIHRMFEAIGHFVEKIKRVKFGPLELDVEPGHVRPLTMGEVAKLRAAVQRAPRERPRTREAPARREERGARGDRERRAGEERGPRRDQRRGPRADERSGGSSRGRPPGNGPPRRGGR